MNCKVVLLTHMHHLINNRLLLLIVPCLGFPLTVAFMRNLISFLLVAASATASCSDEVKAAKNALEVFRVGHAPAQDSTEWIHLVQLQLFNSRDQLRIKCTPAEFGKVYREIRYQAYDIIGELKSAQNIKP